MSLYRTWRPTSFADLVGQDVVVRTLQAALAADRLAHAYLFSGPRGSGKTSAAKILARCIDCVHGPTPEPDNTCENCRAMLAGTALDVLEIDAASNRGIDEIRALRESVKFAPAAMRYKIFIIDEAHMLTREGANAFLKTLEEPPAHAIFILATTAPEALPATILSRCQRYAFRRIAIPVMIERMRQISSAEGIAIGDDALGAIAYRADGGLRDALTMLEQVRAFAQGPIDAATVDAAFGATGRLYARELLRAILGGDAGRALRVVDEASDGGADMTGIVRLLIAEYRNLLVARVDPELLDRDLAAADAAAAVRLAQTTPQPAIVRGLRLLADAMAAARQSGNPRLELETAVLRLAVTSDDPSLEALAHRVALLEGGAAGAEAARPAVVPAVPAAAPAPASPPAAPAAAASPFVPAASAQPASAPAPEPAAPATQGSPAGGPPAAPTLQQVRSLWQNIRTRAEGERASLRAPLSRATVDAVGDGTVTIGLVDGTMESFVREHAAIVERAIAGVLGAPLRVIFRVDAGTARGVAPRASAPSASLPDDDGEIGLLAYARDRLAPNLKGTDTR